MPVDFENNIIKPSCAQSLTRHLVIHFGIYSPCSNFTYNGKQLLQIINRKLTNNLEHFSKEFKVALLFFIKTVGSYLQLHEFSFAETNYACNKGIQYHYIILITVGQLAAK